MLLLLPLDKNLCGSVVTEDTERVHARGKNYRSRLSLHNVVWWVESGGCKTKGHRFHPYFQNVSNVVCVSESHQDICFSVIDYSAVFVWTCYTESYCVYIYI